MNERSEHASNASLNRLRGVANERVRNARVNKRREARGRAPQEVMCAAAARRESEAMRKETRGERNARCEKNERREMVVGREEDKDVRPGEGMEEIRAQRPRGKSESGKWSCEQPPTISHINTTLINTHITDGSR